MRRHQRAAVSVENLVEMSSGESVAPYGTHMWNKGAWMTFENITNSSYSPPSITVAQKKGKKFISDYLSYAF